MDWIKENEAIKDIIIRDIRSLFDQEKDCKPLRVDNCWSRNYTEYEKVIETEIKHYQLENILIKLNNS